MKYAPDVKEIYITDDKKNLALLMHNHEIFYYIYEQDKYQYLGKGEHSDLENTPKGIWTHTLDCDEKKPFSMLKRDPEMKMKLIKLKPLNDTTDVIIHQKESDEL